MRNFPPQYNLKKDEVLYFSHIPKTAGMTFRTIVEDQFPCHEICPATLNEQIPEVPLADMPRFRLFRGHLGFTEIPKLVPGKRIINVNILREPIARVISHYDYIRRTPTDPRYDTLKDATLEEFAEKITLGKMGKNMQTFHVAKLAQFDVSALSPEETLELAKQSVDQFAFVGVLERFQDSLFLLSYIFGWNPIFNSRKENASKKSKTGADVPAATLELIREQTQLDQVLYQYALEIFESRYDQMITSLRERYAPEMENSTPDQVALWLEKHAQERYLERQIPPLSSQTYQFCQALRGSGWHRREFPTAHVVYRWMGDTVSTLDLPLAIDQDLQVEFCVIKALAPDVLQSLTLDVSGEAIPLSLLYNYDNTTILQGTIPRSALRHPFTRFTFRINRLLSPQSLNPNKRDNRNVGLAFTSIQTYPVGATGSAAFLFDSPAWKETVSFVQQHITPDEKILAPSLFREPFPHHVPAFHSPFPGEIRNYNPELKNFQWAIVHKGMKQEIGGILPRLIGYTPVFANEVFVVFQKNNPLPTLAWTDPHVKSLYVGFAKYRVNQWMQPLYGVGDRLKFSLKQNLSAEDLQKLKTYGKNFKQE